MRRLFHYTNQAGLRGIIENNSLWFANILFLNDATEFEYTFKMVQSELEKKAGSIESDLGVVGGSLMAQRLRNITSYERFVEYAKCYYVFSFTHKPDDLSQWRAYGDDSGGYCIEFDLHKMKAITDEKEILRTTCSYDDEKQRANIRDIIEKTYESYKKSGIFTENALALAIGKKSEEEKAKVTQAFLRKLMILAPQFKHPKFHEDAELRMFTIIDDLTDMRLRFRQGKTMIIPYLDIKIAETSDDMPIKSIMIG